MANKVVKTRVQNRFDTLTNWEASSATKLLKGEIAIVSVTTTTTDDNGNVVQVPAYLMKIGNGTDTFDALPWLSATAADVYDWAKGETAEGLNIGVKVGSATTATTKTLGAWIKQLQDTNDTQGSSISSLSTAIETLNGGDTKAGSVAKQIKTAIEALDVSTATGTGNFVTAVTQADGKISVTKGTIAETDLPNISASKIKVDSSTTLTKKLEAVDAAILEINQKQFGHTDAQINTLIDTKLDALDYSSTATGAYVTNVTQANGKISITKGNLPTASASAAGIVKLGATGGAAGYDAVFGTNGLQKTVANQGTEIANIKTAIAGGVHFRGTVDAVPSATTTKVGSYDIAAGDVVIYSGQEYICTEVTSDGPTWEQLGDVTRIGNLETAIDNMDYAGGEAGTAKFVTKVTQTNGVIDAEYGQPTTDDVSAGTNKTLTKRLEDIDTLIASKADAHNHPYASSSHAHGNITNSGTITSTAVTAATGVLVYDSNNKIQRATAANARAIIGAGTSSLTIGTTSTTAAAGNHGHADLTEIKSNYVKYNEGTTADNTGTLIAVENGTEYTIIFDCGGASL